MPVSGTFSVGEQDRGSSRIILIQMADRFYLAKICVTPETAQGTFPVKDGDVSADAWYADVVSWASSVGIVEGYGDGTFGPDERIGS